MVKDKRNRKECLTLSPEKARDPYQQSSIAYETKLNFRRVVEDCAAVSSWFL